MAREPRSDPFGGWHHVTNRGIRRYEVFADDGDRRQFLNRLERASTAMGVEVVAFCLMGNHFHLVLRCPEGGLSETMRRLSSSYTRAFNRKGGYDGPLFKARFYSKPITTDHQLLATVRYVHRNPLELGWRIEDYPWASHRRFCDNTVDSFSRPDLVLPLVGSAADFAAFVRSPLPGDPFQAPVELRSFPPEPDRRSRIDLVWSKLQQEVRDIGAKDRRDALLVLTDQMGLGSPAELADLLRLPSSGSVRATRSRARRRMETDPQFASFVCELQTTLRSAA